MGIHIFVALVFLFAWLAGRTSTRRPADEVERRFREMFYLSSPRWRTKLLQDTIALWPQALARFAALQRLRRGIEKNLLAT